ncbi:hypothetical protein [Mesorhizobium sp.]|nr:hypothetical protein [Mesorhizobium sp.]
MTDIAVAPQDIVQSIGVDEHDTVKLGDVNPERRMVHEQEDRLVARLL